MGMSSMSMRASLTFTIRIYTATVPPYCGLILEIWTYLDIYVCPYGHIRRSYRKMVRLAMTFERNRTHISD